MARLSKFNNEDALIVDRNVFTDVYELHDQFRSVRFAKNLDEIAGQIRNDEIGSTRLIFANPYRNSTLHKLYLQCREYEHPYLVVERGGLPNTLVVDPNGFLKDSSVYEAKYWDHPIGKSRQSDLENYIRKYHDGMEALERQPISVGLGGFPERNAEHRKVILIALQVRTDTVTRAPYCDVDAYDNFLSLCRNLIEIGGEDFEIWFKAHPLDLSLEIEGGVNVNHLHIDDALRSCDIVLTFNSGVGLLAMLHDKPVICVGPAYYQGSGLCKSASTPKEVVTLSGSANSNFSPEMRKRFLSHLVQCVYSDAKFFKAPYNLLQRLLYIKFAILRISFEGRSEETHVLDGIVSPVYAYYRCAVRWLVNKCYRIE